MRIGLILGAISIGAASLPAQVTVRSVAHELGDMVSDVGYVWGSPLRAKGKEWGTAALAVAGFGALLPVDARIDQWVVGHPRSGLATVTRPFREHGGPLVRLGTARNLVPISTALILAGTIANGRGLREAGYGCVSAWGFSNSLRYVVYAAVARERPSLADGDPFRFRVPGGEWDHHAFFAGHATNAFACASFWAERFDLGVAEPALYGAATLVALSRMVDRRHWTSDTFLGGIVGIAAGRVIASRYDRRALVRARRLDPIALARARQIVILWRSSF